MDYLNVATAALGIFNIAWILISAAYGIPPLPPEIITLVLISLSLWVIEFASFSASFYRLINKGIHRGKN